MCLRPREFLRTLCTISMVLTKLQQSPSRIQVLEEPRRERESDRPITMLSINSLLTSLLYNQPHYKSPSCVYVSHTILSCVYNDLTMSQPVWFSHTPFSPLEMRLGNPFYSLLILGQSCESFLTL